MSISPPEAPVNPTPASAHGPLPAPPRRHRGPLGGLILIAVGVVALFSVWFPGGGAWLFLGLGTAFLIARVMTDRHGYAVPAGILLGFGGYVWYTETGLLSGPDDAGTFFIFLGIGFLATYVIAARPVAVWPILPGLVLIGFGTVIQASTIGAPLGQFWWLAQYWPVALLATGAWLLLRDRIPEPARTAAAVIGASVLILIGLLVAASGITSVTNGYPGMPMPVLRGWPPFTGPGWGDRITLTAPGTGIETVRVATSSGRTTVRATGGRDIQVQAARHSWNAGYAPEIQLVPDNGVLTVQAGSTGLGTPVMDWYVDYIIDLPAGVGAEVHSASGDVDVHDLSAPLTADSASGALRISNLASEAQLSTVSGNIVVRFDSAAALNVTARSETGSVTDDVPLSNRQSTPRGVTGALNGGGPTVSIHTVSGSIRLARGG